MQLHLVQPDIDSMNPAGNRDQVLALLRAMTVEPRSLIVLPELFSTGTLPPKFDRADAAGIAEADRDFLAALARETRSHVLAGILGFEGEARLLSNLCVLYDPEGAQVLLYRKIHPFSLGGEDKIFGGGDAVQTAAVEGFTLQPAICYDLRFPEVFRAGARRGVDLTCVPANWPASRAEHWDVLLRARAIENQCLVAGVNCAGLQHGLRYGGGSCIVSPKGEVIAQGGEGACVVSANVTPEQVRAWRRAFPVLRDRKPDGFWTVEDGR